MKVLISVIALLISSTVIAQEDQGIVRLPIRVAKAVQRDLIAKDSCETMLDLATTEILLLNKNVESKQLLIDTLKTTVVDLNKQVENEKNMKLTYKGIAEDCKTEYDSLKSKSESYRRFTKVIAFLGTAVVTGLTAIILFVK